jgi:hypothetical protein
MAMIDNVSEKQRGESDSLEKANIEERSGVYAEESLQRDSGLTPAGVPHEDDPLVCLTTVFKVHS